MKIAGPFDSILSSCGLKVMCREFDPVRFFQVAKYMVLKSDKAFFK